MSQSANNVNNLFQDAHDAGDLSKDALNIILNTIDLGTNIGDALGEDIGNIPSTECILVSIELDDSSSIQFAGNTQNVRDGHNLLIETLKGAKVKDNIQVHGTKLNGGILYPYSFLDNVPMLDSSNYIPSGGTPLHEKTIILLGTVLAKIQQARDAGISQRTITIIITDGGDTGSTDRSDEVAVLTREILRTETNIIFGMGIDDGHTDFNAVFTAMGIPSTHILTPKSDPKEIRKAFQTMSQSASAAAGGATFAGGFGS